MASFVHIDYPTEHPGVARAESVIAAVRRLRRGFDSTKGLAAMLLAAVVSALIVVADQVVGTWADGQLLVAWIVLWAVGFAALALFAGTARRIAGRAVASLDAWSARVAQARADERMLSIARQDARLMSELQSALARRGADQADAEIARPAPTFVSGKKQRGELSYYI